MKLLVCAVMARRPPDRAADRFELVINLRTARVPGRTIPRSALARADELVE